MQKIIDNIQITVGTIDNSDAIADFALRLSEDPFRSKEKWLKIIAQEGVHPLIAMDGTKVIGKIQARILDDIGWVESTRVDPQYRNNGIAKLLVCKSIDWLIQQGVSYLRASVDSDNLSARLILEKYKFSGHFLVVNPSTMITEDDISAENAGQYSQILDKELFERYRDPIETNFSGNVMIDDKYVPFNQEKFNMLVDEKRIYSNGDEYGLLVISYNNLPEEIQGFVISNSKEGYVRAGLAMRAFAAQESASFAIIHAPAKRMSVEGLIHTRFGWNSPHTLIIYQRDLLHNKLDGI